MVNVKANFFCTCGRGMLCPVKLIEYLLENSEDALRALFRQIDEKEAAEFLGCSARTLQGQRLNGGSVPYVNASRGSVRYRIFDIINHSELNMVANTSGGKFTCHHILSHSEV